MRLAFLGSPDASVPSLRALVEAGHDVPMVISAPDRRRGRREEPTPTPLKRTALELRLPVTDTLDDLDPAACDMAIVVAYGQMIPAALLAQMPMLNVHFSLLPRWRGAAPVERAILAGDEETGVCVMGLEETLDTGPVYARSRVTIGDATALELTNALARLGARLVVEVVAGPLPEAQPQVGEPTYAKKIRPTDLLLLPEMRADHLLRVVRLGRASVYVSNRRLRVLRAQAVSDVSGTRGDVVARGDSIILVGHESAIRLLEVQPDGGRPMSPSAWWNGAHIDSDTVKWSGTATSDS